MNVIDSGLSLEVVAAITAAIAAVIDQPVGSFVITSLQPEAPSARQVSPGYGLPSIWGKAGLLESHLARRQFGIRTR